MSGESERDVKLARLRKLTKLITLEAIFDEMFSGSIQVGTQEQTHGVETDGQSQALR